MKITKVFARTKFLRRQDSVNYVNYGVDEAMVGISGV